LITCETFRTDGNDWPMKTNSPAQCALTEYSAGIDTATRGMVRDRAIALAIINGRPAHDASKSDWEQAKRELTRELATDPKEASP
jgi:hypothetical protein